VIGLEQFLIKARRIAGNRDVEPDVLRAGDPDVEIRPVGICDDGAIRLAIVREKDRADRPSSARAQPWMNIPSSFKEMPSIHPGKPG